MTLSDRLRAFVAAGWPEVPPNVPAAMLMLEAANYLDSRELTIMRLWVIAKAADNISLGVSEIEGGGELAEALDALQEDDLGIDLPVE